MCKRETCSRSYKGKESFGGGEGMAFPMGLSGHILLGTCHVICQVTTLQTRGRLREQERHHGQTKEPPGTDRRALTDIEIGIPLLRNP